MVAKADKLEDLRWPRGTSVDEQGGKDREQYLNTTAFSKWPGDLLALSQISAPNGQTLVKGHMGMHFFSFHFVCALQH